MHYNIIHTSQPKRAVQVIQAFENYNAVVQTQEEKYFLKNLPYEPSVITFTKDAKPRDHVIGRHIELNRKAAVNGDTSTYTFWILQNKRRADFEAEKRLRTIDSGATGEGSSMTNDVDVQALQDELVAKDATIAELEMRPTTEDMDGLRETKNKEIDDLKTTHTKDIEALTTQNNDLQAALVAKNIVIADLSLRPTTEHETAMLAYIDTKNAECHDLKKKHTVELNDLKKKHTEDIEANNKETDDLKKKHDADLQALRADATKKDDNIKELEEKLTAAQTTIATLEASAPAVVDQALRARAILAEQANEQLTRDLADMTERHRQAAYTAGDVRKQLNAANLKNADLTKTMRPR